MSSKTLFKTIKEKIKLKTNSVCLDNWVFKLHYRFSTAIFFTASVLVTSREYIGEHIRCISDNENKKFQKVIETFCFFSTTFTVVPHHEIEKFVAPFLLYPGVMPYDLGFRKTIRKHVYYQWVPFLLFGQGILFYLTHLLWKNVEGGRIRSLMAGLTHSNLSFLEKELKIGDQAIPSTEEKNDNIKKIKNNFLECTLANKSWARWLLVFELANLSHIFFQIYITNKFLGGQFIYFGIKFFRKGTKIFDEVFPKVTKCTFHQYGRSGLIENHDALCIMALNVINEKIYLFLWFWFIILVTCSCFLLAWRLVTITMYRRCKILNRLLFGFSTQWKLYPWHLNIVLQQCSYSDWLFLRYLGKNMDGLVFKELLDSIFEDIFEEKRKFLSGCEEHVLEKTR